MPGAGGWTVEMCERALGKKTSAVVVPEAVEDYFYRRLEAAATKLQAACRGFLVRQDVSEQLCEIGAEIGDMVHDRRLRAAARRFHTERDAGLRGGALKVEVEAAVATRLRRFKFAGWRRMPPCLALLQRHRELLEQFG